MAKPERVQLAEYDGDDAIMNDGPPIGQFGSGRTGSPDHDRDRDDTPLRNDDQPPKQVAVLPALAVVAPVVARVALPWVIKGFKAVGHHAIDWCRNDPDRRIDDSWRPGTELSNGE